MAGWLLSLEEDDEAWLVEQRSVSVKRSTEDDELTCFQTPACDHRLHCDPMLLLLLMKMMKMIGKQPVML